MLHIGIDPVGWEDISPPVFDKGGGTTYVIILPMLKYNNILTYLFKNLAQIDFALIIIINK